MVRRTVCPECEQRVARRVAGICRVCYYRRRRTGGGPEPTAEEVEATVAEQMGRLPEWWERDALEQARDDDTGRRVAGVMRCLIARRKS